ncbi:pentatricopeptide repeat-containing protein, mitochondrial [Iris pallida]|uniref:Pentatricopeptide repeat-containing protein, mitochondrial n=1 Tax=Iris pallida TaxID=29817 RepID=A0AAX6IE84_IRIPA|nr:pentatricopeptide repeat-containing protein, mitochondrial [Iris pallida]
MKPLFLSTTTTTRPFSSSSLTVPFSRVVDTSSASSWSSAIADLSRSGHHSEALLAFLSLRRLSSQPSPTPSSLLPALSSAASLPSLPFGRQLHLLSLRLGYSPADPFISSSLINLYSKTQHPADAHAAFLESPVRNAVLYTALVSGLVRNANPLKALAVFKQLISNLGTSEIDPAAIVSAISACARVSGANVVGGVHGLLVKLGMEAETVVGNTLVDAYAKSGEVGNGRKVFDEMPERDEVSWNSMVAVYAQGGKPVEAVEVYMEMVGRESRRSTAVALSAVMHACAKGGAVQVGRCVHNQVIRMALEDNVYVGTSVVDMYCKCGRVDAAWKAFGRMKERNIKTWSAMVAGYGMHGRGREALDVFKQMIEAGVRPNYITFISVLDACSHSGLLEDGRRWFKAMKQDYDIDPGVEHYGCMVDLLGRAGCLDESYGLIKEMRLEPDSMIWGSLLAACRVHKNIELGEISARQALKLDPKNCGFYVSLSNIYADFGRWKDVERMRVLIKTRGIMKPPGYSLVELKGKSHMFMVGDRRHPQHEEIYGYLDKLRVRMQELGYVPDTGSVLHDVEQEEKETILRVHSEKLAVAFAIMSTVPGSPILVIKNLRVCGDCHTAIKMIAKLEGREIVVRDSHRFHHFKDGVCSCGDYW